MPVGAEVKQQHQENREARTPSSAGIRSPGSDSMPATVPDRVSLISEVPQCGAAVSIRCRDPCCTSRDPAIGSRRCG